MLGLWVGICQAFWVVLLLFGGLPGKDVFGEDKSGVGPNSISIPKGPGSIEGLGESFQPTLNTGTAKYGIGIKVPSGTAGQQPELTLAYEGGGGNGPLGFGWQLPLSYIQRRTDHGVPTYGDDVGFPREDTFINEAKEELVPVSSGYYFSKNEGAFVRYRQVTNHWEGTLPNGTKLVFGLTDGGRIQDGESGHVFAWLLEREIDTHGNTIVYSYRSFPGEANQNQKFLAGVAYGPGAPPWSSFHFATFVYQDRSDWFEDCRPGFPVRTGMRLSQIIVGTQGPILPGHARGDFNNDGVPDNLVRAYRLGYLRYSSGLSHWSLLSEVTPVGADGSSALPTASFGYSVGNPPDQLSAAGKIIGGFNEPSLVMNSPLVDFVDLNGDGLPDILKTQEFGGEHTAYLNRGLTNAPSGSGVQWTDAVPVGGDAKAGNVNLKSSSTVAHLADMDGDGMADFVYESSIGDVYYFPNQGSINWGNRLAMSAQEFPLRGPFSNPDVKTADIDFDKRIDVIQSVANGSGADYRLWFNLGGQKYSTARTVPQSNGVMLSWTGVQIADFNGDRLADIARVRNNRVEVTAGLGYGRFAALRSVILPDFTLTDQQLTSAKLIDITGDGLADLVIERAAPGQLWYWINLGNYTFTSRKVIVDMPSGQGLNAVVRWADMNGNGTTDLVYADPATVPRIQTVDLGQILAGGQAPNLLLAITNGIGRVTHIGYESATTFALADAAVGKPWAHPMPFPVQVVTAVTNLDSLGHQYVSRFQYHEGYYDPVEKQFRGFGRNDTIDVGDPSAPTLVTRSFFDTGDIYETMKGRLLALSEEQEDGGVFSVETNSWTLPPLSLYRGTNGVDVAYAHPTGNIKVVSELGHGTTRVLQSAFTYDRYGNQTIHSNYGIVDGDDRAVFGDERITVNQFAINTNAWILRLPSRQEIQTLQGEVISRTEYYYDDESFGGKNLGSVAVGNLTLKLAWARPNDANAYVKTARTKYDPYGNPVTLLDPLATAPGGVLDGGQGHARHISYESNFHAFPITETILVGAGHEALVFKASYDAGFGTISSSTDFNSNQTVYGYDTFGRLVNMVRPGDTADYPTVEYDYALAVSFGVGGWVNYVETRQLDKPPGSAGSSKRDHYFISRQFVDGLGRKLMEKQEAGTDQPGAPPRVVVNNAVTFNARQKPARALNPFYSAANGAALDALLAFESIEAPGWTGQFEASGSLVTLGLASAHQSATAYDALLREVTVTNSDLTFRQTVYEPLLTRSFDENDTDPSSVHYHTPTVHYNDGLGRLNRVDECARLNDDGTTNAAVRVWETVYTYDVNDQLTGILDSQGNFRGMQYDGLQRKVSLNDCDRGIMRFVFDDASNLVEGEDAKGQRTSYTYDGANRILSEDYQDEGLAFSGNFVFNPALPISAANRPDVAYFYDTPQAGLDLGDGTFGTAGNTRGKLAYVWDLSGEEHTSYDLRERVAYVVKRVRDPLHGQLVSFRTGFGYDSADRVRQLVYPDNDAIGYGYNDRSLLDRITGGPSGSILSNVVYWPSGLQAQSLYGNGIQTSYTHDSRLRLDSLLTAPRAAPASPVIALGYSFDSVSNIKRIEDRRPASVVPEGDKRRNTQSFQYDDLYRLTGVQYSFGLPGGLPRNDGQVDYRFDRIGNMLSQTSTLGEVDARTGLPVANLGQMDSGGAAGRFNRQGRLAGDPPGPHALTRIVPPPGATNSLPRLYPYDANGNMTRLDGMVATWDFKDRLVALEDTTMRAEYTYDFTDRRITKKVVGKSGKTGIESFTTIYVGKHFEVREHDAPTKYVFNGETRVARVTGTLSPNERVQRIRVSAGWNLIGLAVTAAKGGMQLAAGGNTQAIYRWDLPSSGWMMVDSQEELAAGTVLWVKATTGSTLRVTGNYPGPTPNFRGPPEGTFLAGNGLEILPLTNRPPGYEISLFDAEIQSWQSGLPPPFDAFSEIPPVLATGEAFFARNEGLADLEVPDPALGVRYYHQDHLGSSAYISDSQGRLVDEEAFFPFGSSRNEFRPRGIHESYTFAQKEQDSESGLEYFEARFLRSSLGRFTRVDPMVLEIEPGVLASPQGLNVYSYALNNPLRYNDPEGKIWNIVGGAAIGATLGLAVEGAHQLYTGQYNGKALVAATVGGAVSGAIAGATFGTSLLAQGATAVASGVAGGIATRAVLGEKQSTTAIAQDAIVSAATFGLVKGGGALIRGLRNEIGQVAESEASLWSKADFKGTRVYQRNDLIEAKLTDARGRSNLQRMQEGIAPIGPDGKSINLHHMIQTPDGPLAEMTATFHQQNSSVIHINPKTTPSGIDRSAFDAFRREYWINRAKDFLK